MADEPKQPDDAPKSARTSDAPKSARTSDAPKLSVEPRLHDDDEVSQPTYAETPEARAKLRDLQEKAHASDETARREALAKEEAGRIAAAVTPAAAEVAAAPLPKAWGLPIVKVDTWLTFIEERLLLAALLLEIGSLVVWVMLRGFALPPSDPRNLWQRIPLLMGAFAALGALVASRLPKTGKEPHPAARFVPLGAAVVGLVVAYTTRSAGEFYFQNILNWLQNASILMLVGGLRGLVTRLTLVLALLGASLATSKGKHINIDVVMRFLTPQLRLPVALVGWLTAAVMCVTGAWGFVDQLALGEYRVERTEPCAGTVAKDGTTVTECEVGPGKKLSGLTKEAGRDFFLFREQLTLDFKAIPKVLGGTGYDKWLTPAQWNEWLEHGDWEKHYKPEDVKGQLLPPEITDTRIPAISIPGGDENPSGILVRDLNLILPFGLLMIAIRFVLRSLLAVSGHVVVDPDAAHAEDDEVAHGVPQPQTAPVAAVDPNEVL